MEKHVYFVRHGETDTNEDGVYRGTQAMLNKAGRAQAQIAAERIGELGVAAIVSSTLPRAVETASAIAARTGLCVEQNEQFVEWGEPSVLFGKHEDEAEAKQIQNQIFAEQDQQIRYSDEETFAEMSARAKEALRFLTTHPAERLCVVTHGGFLRVLFGVMTFEELFTKAHFTHMFRRIDVKNASITVARHDSRKQRWQLITWNDQAHLG